MQGRTSLKLSCKNCLHVSLEENFKTMSQILKLCAKTSIRFCFFFFANLIIPFDTKENLNLLVASAEP